MSERVQVLGVEVDKLGVNRAVNIARTYLKNVNLNIIYFVSKNSAVYAQDHEEFAQFVSQADMVMPADKDMQIGGNRDSPARVCRGSRSHR